MAGLPVYVEQPCRSTIDCILAARGSSLPLVLDESIVSADEVFRAKYEANAAVSYTHLTLPTTPYV